MANVSAVLKPETRREKFDTGLADKYRKDISADLSAILASTADSEPEGAKSAIIPDCWSGNSWLSVRTRPR